MAMVPARSGPIADLRFRGAVSVTRGGLYGFESSMPASISVHSPRQSAYDMKRKGREAN